MNGYYDYYDDEPPKRKKTKRKASAGQKVLFAVIVILYTALLSVITYFLLYKPSTGGVRRDYIVENGVTTVVERDPVEGSYNVLILGMDRAAGLTDVCMLVNVNNNTKSVSVMQIPRDTFVSGDLYTNKFNELLSSRLDGWNDDDYLDAALEVSEVLDEALCVKIHHTVFMDLDGFRGIVDAVGGVEINVPEHLVYNAPDQNLYIDIPAGYQKLNGEEAEKFVRFRDKYLQGDLGRVNAQKLFLTALFDKVKSSISLSVVDDLADEISKNVETDMSTSDIVFYAKCLLNCDISGMNMLTLPGNMDDSMQNYVLNKEGTINAINRYFNTYDTQVVDGMFDRGLLFDDPESFGIDSVYRSSADNVYDSNVYNGQSAGSEIVIPFSN